MEENEATIDEQTENAEMETPSNDSKPWWVPEPYQRTIELSDGTVLNGYAHDVPASKSLWVWLQDPMSIGQACAIFEDPEKTRRIVSNDTSIDRNEYEGYTKLTNIKLEAGGNPTIRMGKE